MTDKFSMKAENSMFLVIDIQKNLAAAMKQEIFHRVEANVNLMISACGILKVPVLLTEQYSKGLGPTVGSISASLAEKYRPLNKLIFSACGEPEFSQAFSKVNRKYVMLAGIESHVCVLQTALDLLAQGNIVHVVSDATCSRYKSDWKMAMDYIRQAGGVITTTEIAVFQLLGRAGTPEFKALSPLFKNKTYRLA